VKYAEEKNVLLATPKIGQTISLGTALSNEMWWKPLETEIAE